MPDDLHDTFAGLDEVRPTPPKVRDRIYRRVVDEAGPRGTVHGIETPPEFDPDTPVFEIGAATTLVAPAPGRGTAWIAAAAVLVLLAGLAVAIQLAPSTDAVASSEFSSAPAESACDELQAATADFELLALDGPMDLSPMELIGAADALQAWIDHSDIRAAVDADDPWRAAVRYLRQAGIDAATSGSPPERTLEQSRTAVDDARRRSPSVDVAACFDRWPTAPFSANPAS